MNNRLALPLFALLLPLPAAAQLGPGGTQSWNQSSPGLGIAMEADAYMGRALAAGDFDCDGFDDLAVGVPEENLGPLVAAGLIHVLYGEPGTGLSASRDQIFVQPIDPGEDGDWFGFALATGRFAGHSGSDLAIGAPFAQVGAFDATGIVSVLASQALFLDGFESGDTTAWSAAAP
ncbi:MAG: hypothetical protein F9K16_06165 [Thermoanaerobaculia bacterium]|nr:MAG: hypothetical protein F9K16_06165 [Thermoanaerobaculia bacterium]MBZ0102291.1 hypothetical protein [Thermoanaerobaculia bacterium]